MRGILRLTWLFCVFALCATYVDSDAEESNKPRQSLDLNAYSVAALRVFLQGAQDAWQHTTDEAKGMAPPPASFPVDSDANVYELIPPDAFQEYDMSLVDILARRRSVRSFSSEALSLQQLSFLLWSAQGVTATLRLDDETERHLRTAPSAGALYPMETFVFLRLVDGLERGMYRYEANSHALVALNHDQDIWGRLEKAHFGSEMIRDAAVVIVFAAVPYRTEWRYARISHRMIAMEAGHALQNVLLAAVVMDAGACAVAAYHQQALDAILGLDGVDSFAMYVAAIGFPEVDVAP